MARISRMAALLAALAAGCSPAPAERPYPAPEMESGGKVIATIGPVQITTAELEKRIRQQSPFVRVQLKDPNKLKLFVEEQIRNEVIAQEAWRRKLYDDPAVQAELRRAMIQKVMKDHLETVKDNVETTETELLTAYKERLSEFNKPEKIRLSQIVRFVDDDGERKEARKLLEKVKSEVVERQKKNDQKAFSEAARAHSEDENTKLGGGDLQFMTQDELAERYGKEVATHMFTAVGVGDMAIADAPNAVVLFKKTGKRSAVERTLEQVKPQLRGSLIGEKRTRAFESFVEELKKKHGVTVDQEAIPSITVEMNTPTEPAPEEK
jgi:peptidyl-prolyl cis-trans isomerase C